MSTATQFRYHTETINGVEIQKPLPKRLHAIIQKRILYLLEEQLAGKGYDVLPELDILCGRDRRCPDLTVYRSDAAFTNAMLTDPPFLAVEIMSPGQTIGNLFDRCRVYLQHGAEWCWVIWPGRRQSWIYTGDTLAERVEGESLIAGLELQIKLDELFRNLPEAGEDE
jgi:Uma2 family endonuclease